VKSGQKGAVTAGGSRRGEKGGISLSSLSAAPVAMGRTADVRVLGRREIGAGGRWPLDRAHLLVVSARGW